MDQFTQKDVSMSAYSGLIRWTVNHRYLLKDWSVNVHKTGTKPLDNKSGGYCPSARKKCEKNILTVSAQVLIWV